MSHLFDTTAITGAKIDESQVKVFIEVDPKARADAKCVPDLASALTLALKGLERGTQVKISIAPGTYREAAPELDWRRGQAADTLLVIEAAKPGTVFWTGSDEWPLSSWKHEGGGLYSREWPHAFGNSVPRWGPPGVIGHRSEMVFVNGWPLRPYLLENYDTNLPRTIGHGGRPSVVEWTYAGKREPRGIPAGGFGVYERAENTPRIFLRLPHDVSAASKPLIEVSTRRRLLDLGRKHHVVLRGVTFQHVANAVSPKPGIDYPVQFGNGRNEVSCNVLIDRCRFVWNSNSGLRITGTDWTLRDSEFSYNGWAGLTTGDYSANLVMERNVTNFNVWRGSWASETGWSTAGFKAHRLVGSKVLGHLAYGNLTGSFGYDIHCKNIYNEDIIALENRNGVLWELSQGPFHGRRLLTGASTSFNNAGMRIWSVGQALLEDSIIWCEPQERRWSAAFASILSINQTNRTDFHSAEEKIDYGPQVVRNTIVAGGPSVEALIHMLAVGTKIKPVPDPIAYEGRDNLFWSEGTAEAFRSTIRSLGGGTQETTVKLDAWMRTTNERGGIWAAPKFADTAKGDFRLLASSPWYHKARSLPSYQTPESLREDLRRFKAWVQYNPQAEVQRADEL